MDNILFKFQISKYKKFVLVDIVCSFLTLFVILYLLLDPGEICVPYSYLLSVQRISFKCLFGFRANLKKG